MGITTPMAMLEGSRMTCLVSLTTSAIIRRSRGLTPAPGRWLLRGSCGCLLGAVFPPRSLHDGDECIFHGWLLARVFVGQVSDLAGRPLRQHLAGVHDRDPIAILRFLHEVRRHDDGHALLRKRRDSPPKCSPREW